MRAPLDQFADRLLRNGEVKEFIEGLFEKAEREGRQESLSQTLGSILRERRETAWRTSETE
jgi:hypothetical protein